MCRRRRCDALIAQSSRIFGLLLPLERWLDHDKNNVKSLEAVL